MPERPFGEITIRFYSPANTDAEINRLSDLISEVLEEIESVFETSGFRAAERAKEEFTRIEVV